MARATGPISRIAVIVTLSALAFAAGLAGPARAQESDEVAHRAGSWALQFSIGEDFQLDSFDGAAVSIQHHTSDRAAWRLGLGFGGRLGVERNIDVHTVVDTLFESRQEGHEEPSDQQFTVDVLRVLYPQVKGRVRPFWGLGPTIQYQHATHDQTDIQTPSGSGARHFELTTWRAGLELKLGVEVLVARRIGILGEYGSTFLYYHSQSEESLDRTPTGGGPTRHDRATMTSNAFAFGDQGARLGVSAYF
jgi:hypothetical protein